jgi:hypothetical protein
MISPEHIAQIRSRLAQGASPEIVKSTVLSAGGITEAEIDQVLGMLKDQSPTSLSQPIPTTNPVVAPVTNNPEYISPPMGTVAPIIKSPRNVGRYFAVILTVVAILLIGGGVAFAYNQGIWPFSTSEYREGNLLGGILQKSSTIHSLTYRMTTSAEIAPRDADAKPFNFQIPDQSSIDKSYNDDYLKMSAVSKILQALQFSSGPPYPATLAKVISDYNKIYQTSSFSGSNAISDIDPITKKPFIYIVSPDRKKYALSVTFETSNALKEIRSSYNYSPTTTPIRDKTVTFTSDTKNSYFYLPERAPDPFLVQLSKAAAYAPSEGSFAFSFGASTDFDKSDWNFNLDGKGDLGDVTYKIDMDAVRKDDTYYLRINNFPALPFLGDLASLKGQWINLSQGSTTSSYNPLSSVSEEIPDLEKNYKQERATSTAFLIEAAKLADEGKLIEFKNPPHKEKINGVSLYRYDLRVRKEAILPFYQKLLDEAKTKPELMPQTLFEDEGLLTYLQSSEFSDAYDYIDKNISIILWVDNKGFPARWEYDLRIVPPDTATQLATKQINLHLVMDFMNINEPVDISTPTNVKSLQELFGVQSDQTSVRLKLSSFRGNAEIYYDSHHSTYSGLCASGDENLAASSYPSKKAPQCSSKAQAYAVAAEIQPSGYWCVDSLGFSGSITTPLGGKTSCR